MKNPNKDGFFGNYGGMFVPDTLMPALAALTQCYEGIQDDSAFIAELEYYLHHFVGRPTPLYYAQNLTLLFNYKIIWH